MKRLLSPGLIFLLATLSLPAEDLGWREHLRLAEEALAAEDLDGYLEHALAAAGAEPVSLNRPVVQYHAARACALKGRHDEAVRWLAIVWDERIEGPMMTLAEIDPAFEATREVGSFHELFARVDRLEIEVTTLGEGLFLLRGAGCDLVVSSGDDGVLLVDSGYPRVSRSVAEAIRRTSGGKPVRFIVNTHEHFDHVGGNVAFGGSTTIISHDNAREGAAKPQDFVHGFMLPAVPSNGLPSVTISAPATIHVNDQTIHLMPLAAHTQGDLVVWFEEGRVVHMGDDYFPGLSSRLYPGPDPDRYFKEIQPLIDGLEDDAKIVTGHRPLATGAELRAAWKASREIYDFVRLRVERGDTAEAILTAGEEQGLPADWLGFYTNALSGE